VSLSSEAKFQTYLEEKESIRIATDEISSIIKKLGKGNLEEPTVRILRRITKAHYEKIPVDPHDMLDEESSLAVRQKLHTIVKSLSTVASFCDRGARNYVLKVSKVASEITADTEITAVEGPLLEAFCTMVNSVSVDFDKTPYSFSGEFKVGFDKFIASVRARYKRGK
jgi:hypothetical protein